MCLADSIHSGEINTSEKFCAKYEFENTSGVHTETRNSENLLTTARFTLGNARLIYNHTVCTLTFLNYISWGRGSWIPSDAQQTVHWNITKLHLRFICIKFSCSIALKTDLSSSVRSNSCDILGDVTTSLCQVISALATLVMSMEPTCQQSTLTLREHKFQDMLEITNPALHTKTTSRPAR